MSRIRATKRKKSKKNKEWPAIVYFLGIGLTFLGYVFGRIALDAYPHHYHWISGLVGGLVGVIVGWLWYWKRGDVI